MRSGEVQNHGRAISVSGPAPGSSSSLAFPAASIALGCTWAPPHSTHNTDHHREIVASVPVSRGAARGRCQRCARGPEGALSPTATSVGRGANSPRGGMTPGQGGEVNFPSGGPDAGTTGAARWGSLSSWGADSRAMVSSWRAPHGPSNRRVPSLARLGTCAHAHCCPESSPSFLPQCPSLPPSLQQPCPPDPADCSGLVACPHDVGSSALGCSVLSPVGSHSLWAGSERLGKRLLYPLSLVNVPNAHRHLCRDE